ncbi:unnamed protein product [Lepeophtheirus salmonis]|uniref:(salmon louse) hypothetical protein n=1 Tax=Lepeophtheirus salmonis TaxID=72036 RepID=A0A7R8CH43_LEPSM|nr:unnamed protein product [Lepeophtheirus salmonis]CAF2781948.1 unnamed protein product [Lepeophtheirus salmonis]
MKERLEIIDSTIIKRIGEHNHTRDLAWVLVNEFVNLATDRVTTLQASTHSIAAEAFVGVPAAVVGQLPKFQNLKRYIRNARRIENQDLPKSVISPRIGNSSTGYYDEFWRINSSSRR